MSLLLEMFTYPFILRAFAVGILVSLCAALLGVPLVLKRYSMIGDGLSHVSFGALAVAVACGFAPLAFSVPVVVASAFLLLRIAEHSRIGADAAIAVLSASALAIGIVVTSLTTGMTTDVDSYMFGSILAMSRGDVALSVTLAAAVLALFILFYHRLFAVTFDESFSRATGVKVGAYHSLLALLTALTVVLNAHDGRHAHLQSHYLPRALGHAHFQELPRGGRVRGRAERGVLLHGADRLVPPLHAGRRERGALQPARVPALLPCGTEITKENSETRSPA